MRTEAEHARLYHVPRIPPGEDKCVKCLCGPENAMHLPWPGSKPPPTPTVVLFDPADLVIPDLSAAVVEACHGKGHPRPDDEQCCPCCNPGVFSIPCPVCSPHPEGCRCPIHR